MNRSILSFLTTKTYVLSTLIALLTLTVAALTLSPGEYFAPNTIWDYDKLGHFLMFGSWTFLIGLYSYISSDKKLHLFTIFFVGVFFGVLIEFLQYALPLHRDPDFFDVAFDALGCLVAVLILRKTLPDR